MYRYTVEDWLAGGIKWMDIETNRHSGNYISEQDIEAIRNNQKKVFDEEFSKKFNKKKSEFVTSLRGVPNRPLEISRNIRTHENIIWGNIEEFEDEEMAEIVNWNYKDPEFYSVKVVPPLGLTDFDQIDLEGIQKAYAYRRDTGEWKYETVEVFDRIELHRFSEFIGHLNAKVSHELLKYLTNVKDTPYNSYLIEDKYIDKVDLLCSGLKRNGYISRKEERGNLKKIFNGKYILQDQRINWFGSQNSLNYLITKIKPIVRLSKNYGLQETASNCFLLKGEEINPENLRKASGDKIDIEETSKMDKIIAKLKS